MPRWLSSVLAVQGGTLFLVGGVIFLRRRQGAPPPGWSDELLALAAHAVERSVIGAWLLALSVAAGLVILEGNLNRLLVPAATYTAFGLFQLLVASAVLDPVHAGLPMGLGLHRAARLDRRDRRVRLLGGHPHLGGGRRPPPR